MKNKIEFSFDPNCYFYTAHENLKDLKDFLFKRSEYLKETGSCKFMFY